MVEDVKHQLLVDVCRWAKRLVCWLVPRVGHQWGVQCSYPVCPVSQPGSREWTRPVRMMGRVWHCRLHS